jgi:HSP20 family molecular chaperone IbpA
MAQEKTAATIEEPVSETAVDEAIASIEKLYETLAGSPPPPGDPTYSKIPVERNPSEFVAERVEQLLQALEQPRTAAGWSWIPRMMVWESPREAVVCLDLPGVKRSEVEIVEGEGVVTVSGQRQALSEGCRLQYAERPLGTFRRQIPLPRGARSAELTARLADGVLEIRIPREAGGAREGRKIQVT